MLGSHEHNSTDQKQKAQLCRPSDDRDHRFFCAISPPPFIPVNYFGGTKGPIQVSRIQNQAPFIMSYDNNYCSGAGGTKWPMGSGGILWRRVAAPCPSEGEGVCARLGTGSAGWGIIVKPVLISLYSFVGYFFSLIEFYEQRVTKLSLFIIPYWASQYFIFGSNVT